MAVMICYRVCISIDTTHVNALRPENPSAIGGLSRFHVTMPTIQQTDTTSKRPATNAGFTQWLLPELTDAEIVSSRYLDAPALISW